MTTSIETLPSATALPDLATRAETARYLSISPGTLARWAVEGDKGPKFIKLGRSCRYRREDILRWIEEQA